MAILCRWVLRNSQQDTIGAAEKGLPKASNLLLSASLFRRICEASKLLVLRPCCVYHLPGRNIRRSRPNPQRYT